MTDAENLGESPGMPLTGPLSSAAFATFALSQSLPLGLIEEGARQWQLPLSERHTPEWFAAAAESHASLLDMAPELRAGDELPTSARDLVGIYGEGEPKAVSPAAIPPAEGSDGIRIGLLRELEGLDD